MEDKKKFWRKTRKKSLFLISSESVNVNPKKGEKTRENHRH